MAKMTSRRVMDQRRKNSALINITVPKEARHLIRAQALREGVSYAEMIRRAILARCGLESWPDFSDRNYLFVVYADDKESADEAIEGLQMDERKKRNHEK